MSPEIVVNESPSFAFRDRFQSAIREAVRHGRGDYRVSSTNLDDRFGLEVRIEGSRGNSWTQRFVKLEAQPDFIRRTVEDALCLLDLFQ
jgi:hypothetical protein